MNETTLKVSLSLQGIAQGLDDVLEEVAGEKMGFSLIVFTEGRASYVSNCEREEVIKEIKYLLECWEKGMPDIPAHEVKA